VSGDPTGFGYRHLPSAIGLRELHGSPGDDPTGFGYRPILDGAAASLPFDRRRTGPAALRRLGITPPGRFDDDAEA
jgi:hypothetical protein